MLDFRTMGLNNATQALELIIIEAGNQRLAIRASSIKRLQHIKLAELDTPGLSGPTALRGYLHSSSLPVFDLTRLLDLGTAPMETDAQILIVSYKERQAGFIVDQTQEVRRVSLNELEILPSIIEQARLRPAAWALWRTPENEIVILIEPAECLSAEEWRDVMNKG